MMIFLRSIGWTVVVTMMTLGVLVSSGWEEQQKVIGTAGYSSVETGYPSAMA